MSATSRRCRACFPIILRRSFGMRHRTVVSPDALGHAATAAARRAASDQHPQHLLAALARLAEAGKPLLGTVQQLR